MGLLNMQLRDQSTVPTPDTGRVILFADSASGKPRAKNATGTIYDFVGNTGTRGSVWTYGTVLPTDPGLSGDMYLKTDSGGVYQSTGGTNWVYIGNITGPQGPATPLSSGAPADVSTSAASGVSTLSSRADHVHAHGNLAGGTLHSVVTGSVNGFMIAADKTKLDTYGALASTTPAAVGTAAVGVSTTLARADHVHAHGNQAGGTLHSNVIAAGAAGFMTGTDKTKLDALGSPATTATTVGSANVAGTSSNLAREDHVHSHGIQTDGTMHAVVIAGGANGFMTGTDKTKLDTFGALATSAPGAIATAGAVGVSANVARQDHTHAHGTQTDGTMHAAVTVSVNGFMIAADKTKLDAMGAFTGFGSTIATVGTANAAGTSTALAREDHVHAHGNQAGGALHAQVTGSVDGFMIAADKARLDTVTAATTTTTVGTTNAAGSATAYSRADHVHAHGVQTDPTLHAVVTGSVNGFMVAADKTKLDTYGALASTAPGAVAAAGATGTSVSLARADHTHAHGTQTDPTMHAVVTGAVNGFMSSADKNKIDAFTGFATTVAPVGSVGSAGVSTNLAREDHVHAHGNQAGGTLHAQVTGSVDGFMIAADKIKLDTLDSVLITSGAPKITATALSTANTQYYQAALTVPANVLSAGSIVRFVGFASVLSTTASALTVRLHYGATGTVSDPVIATTAMPTGTTTSQGSAEVATTVMLRSVGAAGTLFIVSRGSATGTAAFGTSGNAVVTSTGTINTTAGGILGISWSCTVANMWTAQGAWAEVVNQ